MNYRKLRIAWSVVWGLAALLLIVLWVRSYSWREYLVGNFSPYVPLLSFSSDAGQLKYSDIRRNDINATDFAIISRPADDSMEVSGVFDSQLTAGFGVRIAQDSRAIAVPHWFAVVICIALAVVPWIRWRFSLRTLLIATTLVAVVLGLIVWLG